MPGFFNSASLLASSTSHHADTVALNPQPLPPRIEPIDHGFEDGLALESVALNPQPLPPKPAPDPEPWSLVRFFTALMRFLR